MSKINNVLAMMSILGASSGSMNYPPFLRPSLSYSCPKNKDHGFTYRKYCPVCKARTRPKR